jgi:hypothetical protein
MFCYFYCYCCSIIIDSNFNRWNRIESLHLKTDGLFQTFQNILTNDYIFLGHDGASLGDWFLALGKKMVSSHFTVYRCQNYRPDLYTELYW